MSTRPRAYADSDDRLVVKQLNREWEEIASSQASWLPEGVTLRMAYDAIRFNPDKVLLELIAACQAGYGLAGRVIIQTLLGKIITMSRSHPSTNVSAMVSSLWIRISTYPTARRSSHVAANLVLDTLKDSLRETRVLDYLQLPRVDPYDASDVIQAAWELDLASPESLTIVEAVYAQGLSVREVAELHSLTPAAVRRRCSDTVAKLRGHRESLVDHLDQDKFLDQDNLRMAA